MLTVAIPTYNRNPILKKNLPFLLAQLTDQCQLLIIDNCSKDRVDETIQDLMFSYPNVNYRFIRNSVNIGGNANILRCFELCETQWLWILGDDDIPEPDAVKTIFRNVHEHPTITYLNFYSPDPLHPPRKTSVHADGLDDYLSKVDALAPSIFISCNLYRVAQVKKYLSIAMFYQYSCAPQWIILLLSLAQGGQSIISCETIVKNGNQDTPIEDIASPIPIANGLPILMTLSIPIKSKKLLKKVIVHAIKNWVTAEHILISLLIEAKLTKQIDNVSHKYQFVRRSFLYLNPNPLFRLKCLFYSLPLRFPTFSLAAISTMLKLIGSKRQIREVIRKQNEPIK